MFTDPAIPEPSPHNLSLDLVLDSSPADSLLKSQSSIVGRDSIGIKLKKTIVVWDPDRGGIQGKAYSEGSGEGLPEP